MDIIVFSIYQFAVIIFLGNIITELRWLHRATKTNDKSIIHFTIKEIINGDRIFTLPCVFLITVMGSYIYRNIETAKNHWLLFALIAYIVSGVVYTIKVAPLQKKMLKAIQEEVTTPHQNYKKLYASWNFWGWIALLAAATALIFTTIKLPL